MMADQTAQSPTSVSSPASNTPNATRTADVSGNKAVKDKNCPFCHQAFTSSSLGRHLDLYIRPDNPKPPDGVHDVEKIKLVRSGITRRQPRTSVKAKQEKDALSEHSATGTPASAQKWATHTSAATPEATAASTSGGQGASSQGKVRVLLDRDGDMLSPSTWTGNPDNLHPEEKVKTLFNTANWQATGVINNIPPPVRPGGATNAAAKTPREWNEHNGDEPESLARALEEKEAGKAAQMALREVLGSLEAARERDMRTPLFDFDFYSMTFPGLCLEVLAIPQTIFSSNPFPDSDSWTIEPPTRDQYESLQYALQKRIQSHATQVPDSEVRKLYDHLENAFEAWSTLSHPTKASTWHLSILRSFANAQTRANHQTAALELAHQEIEHLRQQRDFLNRCQVPRPMLMHPPETHAVSTALSSSLATTTPESRTWSYERLMGKWRAHVRTSAPPAAKGVSRAASVAASPATTVAGLAGRETTGYAAAHGQAQGHVPVSGPGYNPYHIWGKSPMNNLSGAPSSVRGGAESEALNGYSGRGKEDAHRRAIEEDRYVDRTRDERVRGEADGYGDHNDPGHDDQGMDNGDDGGSERGLKRARESFPGSAGVSLKRKPPPLGIGNGHGADSRPQSRGA